MFQKKKVVLKEGWSLIRVVFDQWFCCTRRKTVEQTKFHPALKSDSFIFAEVRTTTLSACQLSRTVFTAGFSKSVHTNDCTFWEQIDTPRTGECPVESSFGLNLLTEQTRQNIKTHQCDQEKRN